ncbi:hypothetical protein GRJ2_001573100 [Grus japonensis]|uniref:Uncharacterized protein n=1 Tax=Grus japonensis TaxID=30415 RepID=A0ABC9X051_GRUJA
MHKKLGGDTARTADSNWSSTPYDVILNKKPWGKLAGECLEPLLRNWLGISQQVRDLEKLDWNNRNPMEFDKERDVQSSAPGINSIPLCRLRSASMSSSPAEEDRDYGERQVQYKSRVPMTNNEMVRELGLFNPTERKLSLEGYFNNLKGNYKECKGRPDSEKA